MPLWDDILRMALLGSDRAHLSPEVSRALQRYGIDTEDELPRVLLQSMATLAPLRKAQVPISTAELDMPPPLEEEEPGALLLLPSIRDLQQILSGQYATALPEFLHYLIQHGRQVPPEFLPRLLDACLQHPERRRTLLPALGPRALWLIRQRPLWQVLSPVADPKRWEVAATEERQQIIRYLRTQHPEQAIILLKTIWSDLAYREKLLYLALLETGLGPADEEFLAAARLDRRKEVRRTAADLLARLPDSGVTKKLFEYLQRYIFRKPERRGLMINWPEEPPPEALQEVIPVKPLVKRVGSLKRAYLYAALRPLHLQPWLELSGEADISKMIRTIAASTDADLLLAALSETALRFAHTELASELWRYWIQAGRLPPELVSWKDLARLLPATDLQSMAREITAQHPGLLPEQHPLAQILALGAHPWDIDLAKYLVLGLQQWMQEAEAFAWNWWHYKRLLEVAAYQAPIDCLPIFRQGWPETKAVFNQWAADIDRMLQIMEFRREMIHRLTGQQSSIRDQEEIDQA